jgi:hypothetical protein
MPSHNQTVHVLDGAIPGLNLGKWIPNLVSIPSNVAKASLYPPIWSGFFGSCSSIDSFSDPVGRLENRRNVMKKDDK